MNRYKRGMKECRHSYVIYSSILPPQEMRPSCRRRWAWHNRGDVTDGLPFYRCVRDFKKVGNIIDHIVAAGGKGEVVREVVLRRRSGGATYYADRTYHFGGYRD